MMNFKPVHGSLRNVMQYPPKFLQIDDDGVRVPVTYKKRWDDGFGARGWKLDATIGDPEIIASTRETGQRVNTSVFVHDILDHLLSGFGVSGHRSEAMALIQLSKRTGSNPSSDYEQLAKEDILNGRVNGETLTDFLPDDLLGSLPRDSTMTDKQAMTFLHQKMGGDRLLDSLVENFFELGKQGEDHADHSWNTLGLDVTKRKDIGIALQSLLRKIDRTAEEQGIEELHGLISINNSVVAFTTLKSSNDKSIDACRVVVSPVCCTMATCGLAHPA